MEMEKRKVSDSIVETVHMVRPQHLNASDRLFGGALMQWIDEVAGMVAKRHTRRNVITASVDSLSFLRGAYVKDTVVIIGKVTYVGNTSMEVKVDTYVEALSGERTPINHAYFTMVALDKNDRPVRVPRLELETEEEKEEWDKGEKRRELRMMRKEEGLHMCADHLHHLVNLLLLFGGASFFQDVEDERHFLRSELDPFFVCAGDECHHYRSQ